MKVLDRNHIRSGRRK